MKVLLAKFAIKALGLIAQVFASYKWGQARAKKDTAEKVAKEKTKDAEINEAYRHTDIDKLRDRMRRKVRKLPGVPGTDD